MIYDKESRFCIFDGTYAMLRDPDEPNDPDPDDLAAFVYDIRICLEKTGLIKDEDGFMTFADLIDEGL